MKKPTRGKKPAYKKKFKGTRYIAKVLKKYGGRKYKDYNVRVEKSREIYETLKANNQKVNIENISRTFRKHRPSKISEQQPLLNYKLKRPEIYYFDLINFPGLIQSTTNEITFVSDIFNEGTEEIQGGDRPDYSDVFSDFVSFVNKEVKQRDQAYGFRIAVTDPELINGRWVSRIISTDPSGEEDNFGYEPGVGTGIGPTPRTPKETGAKTSEPTQIPQQQPTSEENIAKQLAIKEAELEIQKEKQKSLQDAMRLYEKGLINKLEFKELYNKIK